MERSERHYAVTIRVETFDEMIDVLEAESIVDFLDELCKFTTTELLLFVGEDIKAELFEGESVILQALLEVEHDATAFLAVGLLGSTLHLIFLYSMITVSGFMQELVTYHSCWRKSLKGFYINGVVGS